MEVDSFPLDNITNDVSHAPQAGRFIDAYDKGLNGKQEAWASKKIPCSFSAARKYYSRS